MEATALTLQTHPHPLPTFAMGVMGPRGPNLPAGVQQQQASQQGPYGGAPPRPQEPQQAAQGPQDPPPPPQQTSQGPYGGGPRTQQENPPPHHHYRPPQHHKPFFYVQPSHQPYSIPMHNMGMQWPVAMPMPMPYGNPMVHCGYPGLGYGMQMMPQYQPNPYLEPPGYVLPQTHLHLMDYRRMLNPHHYQTMAYHSRRLRYQHNGPAREMTSCEVQTEPLTVPHRSNISPHSDAAKASNGPPVYGNDSKTATSSSATCRPLSPAVKDKTCLPDRHISAARAAPAVKSSFVIQTEEVTIECCSSTPMGLNTETSELVQQYSHNVVQCSSIATLREGLVPEEGEPVMEQDFQACPDVLLLVAPPWGSSSADHQPPALEEPRSQRDAVSVALDSALPVPHEDQLITIETGLNTTSKTDQFKVLHLPFDKKDLEERQKMDSNLWSFDVSCTTPSLDHSFFSALDHPYMLTSPLDHSFVPPQEESCVPCLEDSCVVPCLVDSFIPHLEYSPITRLDDSCVPSLDLEPPCIPRADEDSGIPSLEETCIPSSEWLNHTCLEAPVEKPTSVEEVPLAEELVAREDVPVEEPVPQMEMLPLHEVPVMEVGPSAGDPLGEMDPSLNVTGLSLTTVSVTEVVPTKSEVGPTAEVTVTLAPNSMLWVDNIQPVTDVTQQGMELDNQESHQETSFESLPAYLPSTHDLVDFEHAYYNVNDVPQTPQKQRKIPSGRALDVPGRGRKLDLDTKEHQVALKPKAELINAKAMVDRRSVSDHECFPKRKFDGNMSTPCAYRGDQICARCLAKHRVRLSTGTGLDARLLKRNGLNFQPLDDALLPTCEACKSHVKKRVVRRVSGPNGPGSSHRREDDTDRDTETSENSYHLTGPKRRGVVDHKKPLSCRPHFEKCPVALYPKLGEKNCVCDELLQQHPSAALEGPRRRAYSNAMREMNRENITVPHGPQKDQRRNMHSHYMMGHKRPTERSWNATEIIIHDTEGRKNGVGSQHFIKHRISQSQGFHGTDTRQ